ncbi:lipopolysaccharide biosynthesis protein RfbH, partial [Kitasatospora sp. NPDC096077]
YIGQPHRVVGELTNSDIITEQTFWVGVYPALTDEMLDYVVSSIKEYVGASAA